MAVKKGLGRGLDALLSGRAAPQAAPGEVLREIPLDALQPSRFQPRQEIAPEALEELAQSIRAQGVVQPLVTRELKEGGYEIIAGERRWRAARLAGLKRVPAVVRKVDDTAAMAVALIENIQREDLAPLDEAHALQRLIKEFKLTHQTAAEAVGRSRAAVSNLLRLLELHPDVQQLLREKKLEMGHARALLALAGAAQARLAQKVAALGLSVRQTEALVKQMQHGGGRRKGKTTPNPRVHGLESAFGKFFGLPVNIKHSAQGKGLLSLRYRTLNELDELLARLS